MLGDGCDPETFIVLGGARLTQLLVSHKVWDASTLESGAWKALRTQVGGRSATIGCKGIFTDTDAELMLQEQALSGGLANYALHFGNGGVLSGAFAVHSYERSGAHDDAEQYTLTLESSGEITYGE
jgi:predicted secreted protein